MDYKQVIVVRQDLKMPKGKTAAQAAHASVEAAFRAEKDIFKHWRKEGMKKIVLKVPSEKDLYKLKKEAEQANIASAVITDAGHTYVAPGTVTCLGIGPGKEELIDGITSKLKLL